MVIYHLVASCNLACATVLVRCHCRDQRKTCSGGDQTRERGIGAEPLGPFPLPSLLFISLRLQWFLHSLMCAFCLAVSFPYWSLDYPMEHHPLFPFNLNMHVGNSAQALLDLLLSATPIYLAHYLYQLLIGCLYILFAVVFWLAGQTNLSGKPYIYKVLDFGGCPLVATLCVLCFVLVCFPLCHFLVWKWWGERAARAGLPLGPILLSVNPQEEGRGLRRWGHSVPTLIHHQSFLQCCHCLPLRSSLN
ncbi:uncharacterized protein LOC115143139 [Oncorhynchus nerka]|uniref:uncharacterized protein LOC115143139 n=1 Tax=Oncorhynchus nerka TaxID=8023 RepID=UPI001131C298|nr:uncharacterized protein LOC115143139 [Oncorhynchus nerka]